MFCQNGKSEGCSVDFIEDRDAVDCSCHPYRATHLIAFLTAIGSQNHS